MSQRLGCRNPNARMMTQILLLLCLWSREHSDQLVDRLVSVVYICSTAVHPKSSYSLPTNQRRSVGLLHSSVKSVPGPRIGISISRSVEWEFVI